MKTLLLCFLLAATLCRAEEPQKKEPAKTEPAAGATEIVHVDAAKARKLLEENAAAAKDGKTAKIDVIDVRTDTEYASGHLGGSKSIDFYGSSFADELAKLDKSQPYLVHCRSGGRSTASLEVFKKLGFKKVYHLDGGLEAWKTAGNPIEK